MKSPSELKLKLRRQWENQALREVRLLAADAVWPVDLLIGRPSPKTLSSDLDAVKQHVAAWKQVKCGEVIWKPIAYRATFAPVDMPMIWRLRKPGEWIEACGNASMKYEFDSLARLAEVTEAVFHPLLIRRRSLWRGKPLDEVSQAARLALALEPGIAAGKPLRTLAIEGIDTKFFERHAGLITTLLDVRFDGEVSKIGLEAFLGALVKGDHWLLVIDLDGGLLPFRRQRVRSAELRVRMLPGKRLLIVENESCQHLLPIIPETIAVLGVGFDLGWTAAPWLSSKRVAYWGDIDTWGLQYLAKARETIGELSALMMASETYEQFFDAAVPEPVIAGLEPPSGLSPLEQALYGRLLQESKGRLEQEFLSQEAVEKSIATWASGLNSP